MKEIKIGEKTIGLNATPLALLFYNQEFNSDLLEDLSKMEKDGFSAVQLLKIVWAMAKAHKGVSSQFPDFYKWIASLDYFNFADDELISAIIEEAQNGFFRT